MTQLTALDANFLNVEGGTTVTHIGGLGVLDTALCEGGRLTRDEIVQLVRERAHLAKPLRQRLVEVPLGLDRPYWIDDPGFDPDGHVHEAVLPAPGDERQLADEVARIHAAPLDRGRPLWEIHLIQGLADGRAALYAKVHHAAVDGVMAAETLAALLDLSPEPRDLDVPICEPLRAPGTLTMLARGLRGSLGHSFRTARSLARTAPYLDEIPLVGRAPGMGLVSRAAATVAGTQGRSPAPRLAPPPTPFNGVIGGRRGFAYGTLSLADVKAIRRTMDVSVNDVVMALCASALRRWLAERDALPARPLVAAVPVSLHHSIDGEAGNKLSVMLAPLPTHIADRKERFDAVGHAMRAAKRRFVVSSGSWLHELSGWMPQPLMGIAVRTAMRYAPKSLLRAVNLIISNVPGPQAPLYLRGARVVGYYPLSVISDVTGGLNVTVFSYDGNMDVGIVADHGLVPDVWELMGYFHEALDELKDLAGIADETGTVRDEAKEYAVVQD